MARNTLEAWLPEEQTSDVIIRIGATSAIDAVARSLPMNSDTKSFPRTAGMDVDVVAKGAAYGEDASLNDEIIIKTRKFGKVVRIAEEDLDDSLGAILESKKADWATSYARILDNACLGVTAAENGTTVPFTSVYRALSQTNAATGYTAGANIVQAGTALGSVTFTDAGELVTTVAPHGLVVGDRFKVGTITATTGIVAGVTYFVRTVPTATTFTLSATLNGATLALTTDGSAILAVGKTGVAGYDNLSDTLALVEGGDYFDESKVVVIAHPTLKNGLRKLKDSNGAPIFADGNPATGNPDAIFGYPVKWSNGARANAVASSKPTGNALVVFVNAEFLFLGVRSGPESVVIDGKGGASALTDETLLKVRARRGFGLANEFAAAILEIS